MAKKPADKVQKGKAKEESKRVGIIELVNDVAEACPLMTKRAVDDVVRTTIAAIHRNLAQKKTVAISGSFILEPVLRPERIGRNPQDPSKQVKIPAHWSVRMKLGNSLKFDLN